MRKRAFWSPAVAVVLVITFLMTTACSCGNLIQRAAGLLGVPGERTAVPLSSTPRPETAAPAKIEIPGEPGQEFVIELTEEQVNELLVGRAFEQAGIAIEDAGVTITPEEIQAAFRVAQLEQSLDVKVTIRGKLVAHESRAYLHVDGLELDRSVPKLARNIVSTALERTIQEISTPYGIPIPNDRFDVLNIQQEHGRLRLTGRTR